MAAARSDRSRISSAVAAGWLGIVGLKPQVFGSALQHGCEAVDFVGKQAHLDLVEFAMVNPGEPGQGAE